MSVAHQQAHVRRSTATPLRVAYQGVEGSYSHLTAQRRYAGRPGGVLLEGFDTFRAAAEAVRERRGRPRAAAHREHHGRQHQRDLRPARRGRPHNHRRGREPDRALPARPAGRQARGPAHRALASPGARASAGLPAHGVPIRARAGVRHRRRCAQGAGAQRPHGGRHRQRVRGPRLRAGDPRARHPVPGGQLHALRRAGARGRPCPAGRAVQDDAAAHAGAPTGRTGPGAHALRRARREPRQAGVPAHPGEPPGATASTSTSTATRPRPSCAAPWPRCGRSPPSCACWARTPWPRRNRDRSILTISHSCSLILTRRFLLCKAALIDSRRWHIFCSYFGRVSFVHRPRRKRGPRLCRDLEC